MHGQCALKGELSSGGMDTTFAVELVVRGYHIYKDVWIAAVGEESTFDSSLGGTLGWLAQPLCLASCITLLEWTETHWDLAMKTLNCFHSVA